MTLVNVIRGCHVFGRTSQGPTHEAVRLRGDAHSERGRGQPRVHQCGSSVVPSGFTWQRGRNAASEPPSVPLSYRSVRDLVLETDLT